MSNSNSENTPSGTEIDNLNKLEAIVRRGLGADVEVGNALAEISDALLYRGTHPTFEAYLHDRWGIDRSRGDQLIQAAALADLWERARREFVGDDVTSIDISLTVRKGQQPAARNSEPWPNPWRSSEPEDGELLRRLRWLLTESSGTIADVAHQLETLAARVDDDVREQLRDDVLVLDEELATLKALLLAPVDWDAEHERLLAGEIPPFEGDADDHGGE